MLLHMVSLYDSNVLFVCLPVLGPNCMMPYLKISIWYHTVRTQNGLSPCGLNVLRQMYRVLTLRLYIASNVSRPLGITSVYRVKCIAPFGHCVCISRQMNRALWALRLYIASNESRPLGIASVYIVKCIVSFGHCVFISRQLVPGTQATFECLPRWMSPRWRWLWRCVYTCPPPAAWPCIPPSPARSRRAPTASLRG